MRLRPTDLMQEWPEETLLDRLEACLSMLVTYQVVTTGESARIQTRIQQFVSTAKQLEKANERHRSSIR